MTFTAYGCSIKFIKQIDVSSNETIEIEFHDADMCDIKAVYSITLKGRIWIGDDIEQDEDEPDNFKVLDGGVNIHCESDTEEEEDEEEEDLYPEDEDFSNPSHIEKLKKRQGLDEDDGFIKFLREKYAKKTEEEKD